MIQYRNYRVKISIRQAVNILLIVLLLLAECHYFFLPKNLNSFFVRYNITNNQQIKFMICLILIFFNIKHIIRFIKRENSKKILIFLGMLILSTLISVIRYASLWQTIYGFINVLYFPAAFITLMIFVNYEEQNFRVLLRLLEIFNIILCAELLVQAYLYNTRGTLFITAVWNDNIIYSRNGMIRITQNGDFTMLVMTISIFLLFSDVFKNKLISIINTVLSFIFLLYGAQARSAVIIELIILFVAFTIGFSPKRALSKFIKYLFLIVLVILITQNAFREIVDSLNISANEKSFVNRFGAYIYYTRLIPRNILSGIKYLDYGGSPYLALVHGPTYIFYPVDVGILGTIVNYGLLIGLWYIEIIISSIQKLIKIKKTSYFLIQVLFLLGTGISLSLLDNTRFFSFAVILVLDDYLCRFYGFKHKVRIGRHANL